MGQLRIDEQLIFDEDSFLLFRADAPDELPLRLGAIASRCLAQLLRSGGAVVRKRELMAGAWGQYGLEVTDNSLAQVVRQLRLALDKLQPGREFIQTLPRIGYKLAEGVRIVELVGTVQAPPPAYDTEEIDRRLTPRQVQDDPPELEDLMSSPMLEPAAPVQQTAAVSVWRWWLWLALPLWGVSAFVLGTVWQAPVLNARSPVFAPPQVVQGLRMHLPVSGLHPLPEPRLQALSQRSQQLAGLLGIALDNAHLYLLPARRGKQALLCEGTLELPGSRCVGVQLHD